MQEKWQKNILRFFILQSTPQNKKSGLGDAAPSSIVPCFGAAVTAEAVVWRDNGATCCSWALIWASASSGLLVRQLILSGLNTLVTSKVLGLKQPKDTFSGPTKMCIFSQGLLFFIFFLLFTCCSVPDRHLQSSLEDIHHGRQPGVNLSNCASCLSDLALPVWSQLSAFTVLTAENYQTQEQVMSPKRHFSNLYFSLSLATAFEISCGSYSSHVMYPGKLYQRRDTKMPVGIATEGYGAIFSALFSSFPSCEPIKFLLGSSLKDCDSQTC